MGDKIQSSNLSYGFYNSKNGDRTYNAMSVGRLFDGLITDGVYSGVGAGEKFKIVLGTTPGTIKVKPGKAWFNHTWTHLDGEIEIEVPGAAPSYERYDTIYLTINRNIEPVGTNSYSRENYIEYQPGTERTIASGTAQPSRIHIDYRPEVPSTGDYEGIFRYRIGYIHINGDKGTVGNDNLAVIEAGDIFNVVGSSETPYAAGVAQSFNIDAVIANLNEMAINWFSGFKTNNYNKLQEMVVQEVKKRDSHEIWFASYKLTDNPESDPFITPEGYNLGRRRWREADNYRSLMGELIGSAGLASPVNTGTRRPQYGDYIIGEDGLIGMIADSFRIIAKSYYSYVITPLHTVFSNTGDFNLWTNITDDYTESGSTVREYISAIRETGRYVIRVNLAESYYILTNHMATVNETTHQESNVVIYTTVYHVTNDVFSSIEFFVDGVSYGGIGIDRVESKIRIFGLAEPDNDDDAATKKYVDDAVQELGSATLVAKLQMWNDPVTGQTIASDITAADIYDALEVNPKRHVVLIDLSGRQCQMIDPPSAPGENAVFILCNGENTYKYTIPPMGPAISEVVPIQQTQAQVIQLDSITSANAAVMLAVVNAAYIQGIPIIANVESAGEQVYLVSCSQEEAVFHGVEPENGYTTVYTLTSSGVAHRLDSGVKTIFLVENNGVYSVDHIDAVWSTWGELLYNVRAGVRLRLVLTTGVYSGQIFDLAEISDDLSPVLWFRGQITDGTDITEHMFGIDSILSVTHVAGTSGSDSFIARIIKSSGIYSCDKSFAEIKSALTAGKHVSVFNNVGAECLLMVNNVSSLVYFTIDDNDGGSSPMLRTYNITSNGVTSGSFDITNPPIPFTMVSDANKFLTVNSSGMPTWTTIPVIDEEDY